ncbi:MAG: hypothetical protein ILO68_00085 [Clostridia bacterium]|nr:hypothetical protein [Clostridia bacterium]
MGTHYYVYAEVKVNGRWYNLNPVMKKPDGSLAVRPIYDARSAFHEIYNDLECSRISVGIPDDMSPELRSLFHDNLDEPCDGWYPGKTWRAIYQQMIICVKYSNTIGKRVFPDRPYKYEGYVSKRAIADFEIGETERIVNWLSPEEYDALSDRAKKQYRFYQWNEPFDEYECYRTIYERLRAMLYWFDYGDAFEDRRELWDSDVGLSDIRLFIEWN